MISLIERLYGHFVFAADQTIIVPVSAHDNRRILIISTHTPTVCGCNPLSGLAPGDWKLIQTTRPELYDLSQDPEESNNVAGAQRDRSLELERQPQEMIEENVRTSADGENVAHVDEQTMRQLESLGYVGGTVDE